MTKKTAVITGASKGIGLAIAQNFLSSGHTVISLSRTAPTNTDPNLIHIECDVSNENSIREATNSVRSLQRPLDILVYSSGTAKPDNFLNFKTEAQNWKTTLSTNLNGAVQVSQRLIDLIPDEHGKVIFIGSISSFRGSADLLSYSTSKHALIGLVKSLAKLLSKRRISVNAICPGFVKTDMITGYLQDVGLKEEELLEKVPFGRFIQPEEIADLTAFLCSDATKNITGQSFVIDGGLLA